jgi:hypothetical protein
MADDQFATIETLETSDCIASDPQISNCDSNTGPPSRKIIMLFLFFIVYLGSPLLYPEQPTAVLYPRPVESFFTFVFIRMLLVTYAK